MVGTIVFLTPTGALVGLAFLVTLASAVVRAGRERRARGALQLATPSGRARWLRPLALVGLGALVAATAAQPALRARSSTPMRSDAEVYLTFDVTRSMLARSTPDATDRLERSRALGLELHAGLLDFPTGVATLTNRMMPLLFPTGDGRGVTAVLERSLRILQPQPARLTAARATQLGVLTLAADRSYFNPQAKRRALVVFTDLDTDYFSLTGTLRLLREHRIEPFVVRVAKPGEAVFGRDGRPLAYRPNSTVAVTALRRAGWHAYEETEGRRAIGEIRSYLGGGPVAGNGLVESERPLAPYLALAALVLTALLVLPALRLALRRFEPAPRGG